MAESSNEQRRARVILANDSELVIEGLSAMLAPYADRLELVGTATGDPAIVSTEEDFPEADVLLIDTFSREGGGIRAAGMLVALDPPFAIALYTDREDERMVLEALRVGVRGYLLKSTGAAGLAESLVRLARGESVIDAELASRATLLALDSQTGEAYPGAALGLTRREAEVLVLFGDGHSVDEVATKLSVGRETVRSHTKRIYTKLGVNDRTAAVAIAWQVGLMERPPVASDG